MSYATEAQAARAERARRRISKKQYLTHKGQEKKKTSFRAKSFGHAQNWNDDLQIERVENRWEVKYEIDTGGLENETPRFCGVSWGFGPPLLRFRVCVCLRFSLRPRSAFFAPSSFWPFSGVLVGVCGCVCVCVCVCVVVAVWVSLRVSFLLARARACVPALVCGCACVRSRGLSVLSSS